MYKLTALLIHVYIFGNPTLEHYINISLQLIR